MNKEKTFATFGKIAAAWLAITFVLTGPLLWRACQKSRGALEVFDSYSHALVSKDFQGAYGYGSEAFAGATPYPAYLAQQKSLADKFGELREVKRTHYTVTGNGLPIRWIARIDADHFYKRGQAHVLYEFHYENERWRLYGFHEETD